jgi:Domain of unknown function (DUF4123)
MLGQDALSALKQVLWAAPGDRVYALLDGASIGRLLDRLYAEPRLQFECLLHGQLPPDVAEVAPYLVALERDSELAEWVIAHGWGNHWGSFALARCDLRTAWFHLRTLNIVHGPDGNPKLFRYYDPRVLRMFLPTCTPAQVLQMFGPVSAFVAEGEAASSALVFAHAGGELQRSSRPIAGIGR